MTVTLSTWIQPFLKLKDLVLEFLLESTKFLSCLNQDWIEVYPLVYEG